MKIKKLALILLSLVMMLGIVACSNNTDKKDDKKNDADQSKTVTVTPAEIEKKIADAVGKDNYLCDTDIDKETFMAYYGLDESKIESFVAKQNAMTSLNLDKVIVLKVKDGYASTAVDKLNEDFAQFVSYIRQYPFGTAKVLNARLYQSGNYVVFVIAGASYDGEDTEAEAKLATTEYAKIDAAIKEVFGSLPKNSAVVPESNSNNTNNDNSHNTGGLVDPNEDNNDDGENGIRIGG